MTFIKKNNLKKLTAWGSWKSPSCPYLSYPFEFIEVFSKDNLKHIGDKENIDITKDEFIKYVNLICLRHTYYIIRKTHLGRCLCQFLNCP